eukprot:gene39444-48742_t
MKQDPRFPNLFITDHPLIQHKLSHMRDKATSTRTFRELLKEITLLMGYEITRDLPLGTRVIETPLMTIDAPVIAGRKLPQPTQQPKLQRRQLLQQLRKLPPQQLVKQLHPALQQPTPQPPLQAQQVPTPQLRLLPARLCCQCRNCRYNGYLAADVNGGPAPGFSSGQAQAAIERIAAETLPQGITFEWTELTYQEILAGNSAVLVFPLAILLVFLVLAAQYESLTLPIAIILIVPMGLLAAMT